MRIHLTNKTTAISVDLLTLRTQKLPEHAEQRLDSDNYNYIAVISVKSSMHRNLHSALLRCPNIIAVILHFGENVYGHNVDNQPNRFSHIRVMAL